MARRTRVGELRPSQLLHTYGVGAIVDLPYISAIVMGLDDWDVNQTKPVIEERVLAAVRRQLGDQVEKMVSPPMPPEDDAPFGQDPAQAQIGVPVSTFPRTMRCPACQRLGPRVPGIFDLKPDLYRPERTRYVHSNCQKAQRNQAVLPARFVVACPRGHLDDFPWTSFVHRGPTHCRGELAMFELGVSGEAAEIEVRCKQCDQQRRMAEAFGEDGLAEYRCRGRRPHLRDFDEKGCEERPRAILLGASNSWFAVSVSALYVPPSPKDELASAVEDHWALLADAETLGVLTYLRKRGELGGLARFADEVLFKAIEARRAGAVVPPSADLKAPEWRVFSSPGSAPRTADFRLTEEPTPKGYEAVLERVVLVERLREVTALTGFTRVDSPLDFEDATVADSAHRAPLTRKPPRFVPASEVRGEGIFLQLREPAVARWCAAYQGHEDGFFRAHKAWRASRKLSPVEAGFPGLRFILLHSFAHALMRQVALECGYTAASIRERIYSARPEDDEGPMAGILLYTAAPDSEGTLGGLVSLGRKDALGRHIEQALEHLRLCSSDPLCADHVPGGGGPTKLHGAACHACLFAPETSCERGNKYLDRTVLVPTVSGAANAFFGARERGA